MNTQEIPVNREVLKRFSLLMGKKRLAHAYLFVGPLGVGKKEAALALAKLVNCESLLKGSYCNQCATCININNGNHPDIHIFSSDKSRSIKIEQVRTVIKEAQIRPFQAKVKVFIIEKAEELTLQAQNALLKTLEEPSFRSLLILTTAFPDKILDTIKSRAHSVSFFGMGTEDLQKRLATDYGVKKADAHFLAFFTEGALRQALHLHEENFFEEKNQVIDEFLRGANDQSFLKQFLTGKDNDEAKRVLDLLLSWFRDLMLLKLDVSACKLVHADRQNDLVKLAGYYTLEDLQDIIDAIIETSRLLKENLSIKMAFTLLKERICHS